MGQHKHRTVDTPVVRGSFQQRQVTVVMPKASYDQLVASAAKSGNTASVEAGRIITVALATARPEPVSDEVVEAEADGG